MVERIGDYDDEDKTVPEKGREFVERQEAVANFISRLQELGATMLRTARAERVPAKSRGELRSNEDISERLRQERQAQASIVASRIETEGLNQRNMKEVLGYLEAFNHVELLMLASLIDHLLLEWDPTFHAQLRSAQEQLRAMARLKQSPETI